jgi:hypothetical protein
MDNSSIELAAAALAAARHKVTDANAAAAAANGAAASIQERVDALTNERTGLIAAARNGDTSGKAALRLAVIDEDLKELAPLVRDAIEGVRRAEADAAKATAAVAQAETALAMARDADLEDRLVAHATRLDELLAATISEIETLRKRRGSRPVWFPSGPLADVVTRLHLVGLQSGGRR